MSLVDEIVLLDFFLVEQPCLVVGHVFRSVVGLEVEFGQKFKNHLSLTLLFCFGLVLGKLVDDGQKLIIESIYFGNTMLVLFLLGLVFARSAILDDLPQQLEVVVILPGHS